MVKPADQEVTAIEREFYERTISATVELTVLRGGGMPHHRGAIWGLLGSLQRKERVRGESGQEPLWWFLQEGKGRQGKQVWDW